MRKLLFTLTACSALLLTAACGGDDNDQPSVIDTEKPVISEQGIIAVPTDCQVYHRGDVIPFNYVFTDNLLLGNYNIEVHQNFNHHTHSGSSVECALEPKKTPVRPWVENKDYNIPAGLKSYTARHDIKIPADIDTGDYHFMIRLTDDAGHQQLKGIAIKIVE